MVTAGNREILSDRSVHLRSLREGSDGSAAVMFGALRNVQKTTHSKFKSERLKLVSAIWNSKRSCPNLKRVDPNSGRRFRLIPVDSKYEIAYLRFLRAIPNSIRLICFCCDRSRIQDRLYGIQIVDSKFKMARLQHSSDVSFSPPIESAGKSDSDSIRCGGRKTYREEQSNNHRYKGKDDGSISNQRS